MNAVDGVVHAELAQTFHGEDHRQAVRAFAEKRPPRFRGR